jgi:hypothetical protein
MIWRLTNLFHFYLVRCLLIKSSCHFDLSVTAVGRKWLRESSRKKSRKTSKLVWYQFWCQSYETKAMQFPSPCCWYTGNFPLNMSELWGQLITFIHVYQMRLWSCGKCITPRPFSYHVIWEKIEISGRFVPLKLFSEFILLVYWLIDWLLSHLTAVSVHKLIQ